MATINYLPSFPISDRVFPCPRKHMLIYGQKSPSPPPATLTQEQLARDAGQLVEAHALLDMLCDDTDRSQHSLVHRIKQILLGSEEMSKVLEKAGFNTAAGLLECVRALAQRQKTTKETLDQVEARALGYQLEITRLKDRNKRLHDAQGSGCGNAAAELKVVRDILSRLTSPSARDAGGMAQDVVTMNITQQGEIVRLRDREIALESLHKAVQAAQAAMAESGLLAGTGFTIVERVQQLLERLKLRGTELQEAGDVLNKELAITKGGSLPVRIQRLIDRVREGSTNRSLIHMVQQAHGHMNEAGVALEGDLNIEQRVKALVEERDKLKSDTFTVLKDKVQAAHRKLNTIEQVSTFGTIDERVASLVDVFKARVASVAVPPEYDKRYHEKLNELPEIERTGTLLERVTQAVDRLKDYGQRLDLCRDSLVSACKTLGIPFVNYTTDWLAKQINDNLARWRESSEKMAKWVGDAHAELSKAGIAGAAILPDRVRELISERDRCKALQADVLPEVHRMLDKAGIPNGTLDERVRVAIERGQQAKLAPDAAHCVKIVEECTRKLTQADVPTGNLLDRIQMLINDRAALLGSKTSYGVSPTFDEKAWEVRNRDNRVMAVCTSLADAQRIRASLEAR